MLRYCPVCDGQMDAAVCPKHDVPTVNEACFVNPHIPMKVGDLVDDKYIVRRRLGEGSMGTVYEVSSQSNARLALKVIKVKEDSSRQVTKRFYREALAGSKVTHPNVVSIVDFGVDERTGQPYQAMEFIEGVTLDEFARDTAFSMDTVLDITSQALNALGHLHELGIVHRDLKPENIMISGSEHQDGLKLLDFGIAKILEHEGDAPTLTATGVAVGTPHYMSPEQAKGERVTPSADLYSFGCILYELLTGSPLFDGGDFMSVLISHVRDPAPDLPELSHWGEAIPSSVRNTVAKSLSKSAKERPPTASDMLFSLRGEQTPAEAAQESGLVERDKVSSSLSVWMGAGAIMCVLVYLMIEYLL